jgi:hypothetical protein
VENIIREQAGDTLEISSIINDRVTLSQLIPPYSSGYPAPIASPSDGSSLVLQLAETRIPPFLINCHWKMGIKQARAPGSMKISHPHPALPPRGGGLGWGGIFKIKDNSKRIIEFQPEPP